MFQLFRPGLALVLCLSTSTLLAEAMSVSTLQISRSESYDLNRIYGGQLKYRRSSQMGFETAGVIGEVHVSEGDLVKQGEPLVTLDQAAMRAQLDGALAELDTAKAMVRAQQAQLALSKSTFERNLRLS